MLIKRTAYMNADCRHFIFLIMLAVAACSRPAVIRPAPVAAGLNPVRAANLPSPAVAVCADGDGVLALEASGARVLRFDARLVPVETLPLTDRVVGPRGIGADRYYVYVYDERTLYRLLKTKPALSVWLNGIRAVGLAGYAPGEMLVSDGERAAVWLKTLFGESRKFLEAAELARPGALAALPDGEFAALSGGNVIVRFNRAGIVTSRQILADTVDLMVADRAGTLYLARSGRPELILLRPDGRSFRYELHGLDSPPVPYGLAFGPDGLVLLDQDVRLLVYAPPGVQSGSSNPGP